MTIEMVKLYECGYCTHPEKMVNPNASLKTVKFPATVALIKHVEEGYILFDTGYSSRFFEATKRFPYSVYGRLTPVYFEDDKSIVNQLHRDGIQAKEIKHIILSHFHGDHTAGLKDFPLAKIHTFQTAYNDIKGNSGFKALTKGCLLELLPDDIESRLSFIDAQELIDLKQEFGEFKKGFKVFDNDAIIAVELNGHAAGQFGIFIKLKSGKRVFLCADAVWLSDSYVNLTQPHWLAYLLIADKEAYSKNITRLNVLSKSNPEIDILPTHCSFTWEKIREGHIYE